MSACRWIAASGERKSRLAADIGRKQPPYRAVRAECVRDQAWTAFFRAQLRRRSKPRQECAGRPPHFEEMSHVRLFAGSEGRFVAERHVRDPIAHLRGVVARQPHQARLDLRFRGKKQGRERVETLLTDRVKSSPERVNRDEPPRGLLDCGGKGLRDLSAGGAVRKRAKSLVDCQERLPSACRSLCSVSPKEKGLPFQGNDATVSRERHCRFKEFGPPFRTYPAVETAAPLGKFGF